MKDKPIMSPGNTTNIAVAIPTLSAVRVPAYPLGGGRRIKWTAAQSPTAIAPIDKRA